MLVFEKRGKTGVPGEKPLGARMRTNNKLNPHMTSSSGMEPGPHWWEARALAVKKLAFLDFSTENSLLWNTVSYKTSMMFITTGFHSSVAMLAVSTP